MKLRERAKGALEGVTEATQEKIADTSRTAETSKVTKEFKESK